MASGTQGPRVPSNVPIITLSGSRSVADELLAVTPDIDLRDEFVEAPNLASREICSRGSDGQVLDVDSWNWIARRNRQDGQADFIVRTDIRVAVLAIKQHDNCFAILLPNRLQSSADKQLCRPVQVG